MNAARTMVEVGRVERNVARAQEAWKIFRSAEDQKRAEHKLREARGALEAALRGLDKLAPKEVPA
jgi:hypothetical protein